MKRPPHFLRCEDMDGAPAMIAIAQIVGITNRVGEARSYTDDELYVTTIHTTGRTFHNINASMEQIETAIAADGIVRFE